MTLPIAGSVLGVDVGWSAVRTSSAVCRLDWDAASIHWTIERFKAVPEMRDDVIRGVAGAHRLMAAAFDGPFRGDLAPIGNYRRAEKALTLHAISSRLGKLAQSNSGNGRLLNAATNDCVASVLAHCQIAGAAHACSIHCKAVAEAFPNSFLGLMLSDPVPLKGGRGQRSDRYYGALAADGSLQRLFTGHLPGRRMAASLESVTNHDDRAALVCAITALGIAGRDYVAVGDGDGWIILPPAPFIAPWARSALKQLGACAEGDPA